MALSTKDVLERHLRYRADGDLERDLRENYAPDVVLLSYEGVHHGHDGVRKLAAILGGYASEHHYQYDQLVVDGDHALLRWSAEGASPPIDLGVDSFVVRDGRILAQTIYFVTASARGPGS